MKKTSLFFALTLASGATLAASAGHGDDHIPLYTIGIQILNLGILVIALFFFTRKSIIEAFAERKTKFNAEALKTAAALKAAEGELSEIKTKLSTLESSEQTSLQKAALEADEVGKKMVSEAQAQAKKIKEDTALVVGAEVTKARSEIRNQIIETSLAAAQSSIQQASAAITKKSENAFLEDLGQVKA